MRRPEPDRKGVSLVRLLMRLLAVVALLAVPLGLAVASQALADRPGPPSVPAEPVVIEEPGPPPPAPSEPATPSPTPSDPAAEGTTAPPAPQPERPQVVDPAPIPVDDDADGDPDDAEDGPEDGPEDLDD